MGDRGNIFVRQRGKDPDAPNAPEGIYLYTLWAGDGIQGVVRAALARKERWDDAAYLTRILWDALVPADDRGKPTGYGLSLFIEDNDNEIVEVDTLTYRVVIGEKSWSFDEFIERLSND